MGQHQSVGANFTTEELSEEECPDDARILIVRIIGCKNLDPTLGNEANVDPYVIAALTDDVEGFGEQRFQTDHKASDNNPRWIPPQCFKFVLPSEQSGAKMPKLALEVHESNSSRFPPNSDSLKCSACSPGLGLR